MLKIKQASYDLEVCFYFTKKGEKKDRMENQNTSSRFQKNLKKHYEWLIVLTLLGVVLSSIYTFFIATPIYEASAEIFITAPPAEAEEVTDTPPASMATYSHILTSDVVLEPAIEELDLTTTPTDLRNQVTAEHIEDSEILMLYVQNENPYQASDIANAIASHFEATVEETTTTETVQILTAAVPSTDPVRPNNLVNILIGTLIGFVVGLAIIASQGGKKKTETLSLEKVEEVTGLKNIGNISTFTEDDITRPQNKADKAVEIETEAEETLSRMDRHRP